MASRHPRVWAWRTLAHEVENGSWKPRTHPSVRGISELAANLIPYVVGHHRISSPPRADVMLAAMKLQEKAQSIYSSKEKQPEVDERVIVIARGFRCLGYLDPSGIWRYDSDGAAIENVLNWTRNRRP